MPKSNKLLLFTLSFFFIVLPVFLFADETLTITTYYPSPYGSYSQLTADQIAVGSGYRNPTYADGTLYVSGSVGIGTTSPGSKLTVQDGGIQINTTGKSSANFFNFSGYYANNLIDPIVIGTNDTTYRPIAINYYQNTPGIVITASGNVGIGTTVPTRKLEIATNGNIFVNGLPGSGGDFEYNGGSDSLFSFYHRGEESGNTTFTWYPMPDGSPQRSIMTLKNSGNVGIGATSPGYKLDLWDSTDQGPRFAGNWGTGGEMSLHLMAGDSSMTDSTASKWKLQIGGTTRGDYLVGAFQIYEGTNASAGTRLFIKSGGNVGIGLTNPSYQLQLSTDSAAKPGTNTWTIASDRRVKKDIRPYTNGLSIIKRINPVWFKYNGKAGLPDDNQNHIGVIGQEIVKVAPYTINTFKAKLNPEDKESTELLNFNSHALTFDLINSVKELDSNITKLAQENHELKSELENLKTRLSRLEARK